jgi:hypothetical protein
MGSSNTASSVVHAVARAEIDAQLAQAFADRSDIAGVAIGQPVDMRPDLGLGASAVG